MLTGLPGGPVVQNRLAMQGTLRIPGLGRSLGAQELQLPCLCARTAAARVPEDLCSTAREATARQPVHSNEIRGAAKQLK